MVLWGSWLTVIVWFIGRTMRMVGLKVGVAMFHPFVSVWAARFCYGLACKGVAVYVCREMVRGARFGLFCGCYVT